MERGKISAWIITTLAIGLRCYRVSDQWFGYDSAFWTGRALDILEKHHLSLTGQTAGLGPVTTYLTWLSFVLFGVSAESGMLLFALLTGLATLVVYRCARELYGSKVALLAALLYAINPYLMQYKSIWPQNLLFLLLPAVLWLTYRLSVQSESSRRLVFCLGVLIGLAFQCHLTAFTLWGTIAIIAYAQGFLWGYLKWGTLGILLGYSPNLLHEVIHQGQNLRFILLNVVNPNHGQGFRGAPASLIVQARRIFESYFTVYGGMQWGYLSTNGESVRWSRAFHALAWEPLGFLFFCIGGIRSAIRGTSVADRLLLIWFCVPLLSHLVFRFGVFPPHYMIIFFPAIGIGASAWGIRAWEGVPHRFRVVARAALGACLAATLFHHTYDLVYRLANFGFGVPTLRQTKQAIALIEQDCASAPVAACIVDLRPLAPLIDMYSYLFREWQYRTHQGLLLIEKARSEVSVAGRARYYYLLTPQIPAASGVSLDSQAGVRKAVNDRKLTPFFRIGLPSASPREIYFEGYRLNGLLDLSYR